MVCPSGSLAPKSAIRPSSARSGIYPASIVADVSPERLRFFFRKLDGNYRISKLVRDLCIFARHDLTRDPPFSKLDLVHCRNVLIYPTPVLQKRLMTVFHYSLETYLEDWSERTKLAIDFGCIGLGQSRLSVPVETTVFRVILEAINNVIKHAHATAVNIVLRRTPAEGIAIVEENGYGFDAEDQAKNPKRSGQLGLLGMKERAALVGGTIEIESRPGIGTTIFPHPRAFGCRNGRLTPTRSRLDNQVGSSIARQYTGRARRQPTLHPSALPGRARSHRRSQLTLGCRVR